MSHVTELHIDFILILELITLLLFLFHKINKVNSNVRPTPPNYEGLS